MAEKTASESVKGLLVFGFYAFLFWLATSHFLPDEWRIKYSVIYLVSWENVTISPRPTTCDWARSPLGDKGCHYEKTVSTTMWKQSDNGHPVVSYDDGKTWETPVYATAPKANSLPIEYIYVGWNKVEDP